MTIELNVVAPGIVKSYYKQQLLNYYRGDNKREMSSTIISVPFPVNHPNILN